MMTLDAGTGNLERDRAEPGHADPKQVREDKGEGKAVRKVLFVSTLYYPHNIGGAEATVRMLAETLVAQGCQAVVVTLVPDGRESVSEVAGVRVYYLPLANLFFSSWQ